MRKRVKRIVICCICIVLLAGCTAEKFAEETTQPSYEQTTQSITTTVSSVPTYVANITTSEATTKEETTTEIIITEAISQTQEIITPAEPPTAQSQSEAEETTIETTAKVIEKTGEMAFSDDISNRYISAVSQKYNVNARNLVALYTVPENDSNIVLEFDGTENEDGTVVRNKDTLIAIYSIDKELNSKRASEDRSLNEYSYGEMKVMFFTTTSHIMPEFEELK